MTVFAIPGCFTESVSATTSTNTVDVGTIRFEGGKLYKYVYFENSGQVGYAANYTSGGSGNSVVVGSSIVVGDPIAGVIQNTSATTAKYGWLLVEGIATLVAGSFVSAVAPIAALTAGTWGSLHVAASAATAGQGMQAGGFALTSAVTTTAGTTFLATVRGFM